MNDMLSSKDFDSYAAHEINNSFEKVAVSEESDDGDVIIV